jgi:hypothetical protein
LLLNLQAKYGWSDTSVDFYSSEWQVEICGPKLHHSYWRCLLTP